MTTPTAERTDRRPCPHCDGSAAGCRSVEWLRGSRCCERCPGDHDGAGAMTTLPAYLSEQRGRPRLARRPAEDGLTVCRVVLEADDEWLTAYRRAAMRRLWESYVGHSRFEDREVWAAAFRRTGYAEDCRPAARPTLTEPLTMYRGSDAGHQRGLSWTLQPWLAARYAMSGWHHGGWRYGESTKPDLPRVWVAHVDADRLFGRIDTDRKGVTPAGWVSEHALDPVDLVINEYDGPPIPTFGRHRPDRGRGGS